MSNKSYLTKHWDTDNLISEKQSPPKVRVKSVYTPAPKTSSTKRVVPSKEVQNSSGAYVFKIDPMAQLERFLILGTEGGTFYASEKAITTENLTNVEKALNEFGKAAVDLIVEVSDKGRAVSNDPALFALAMCASIGGENPSASHLEIRRYALSKLSNVARTGTHLYHFISYVSKMRGFGRSLKNAIANWFLSMDDNRLALQAIKYQGRDGWTARDVLRLSHPKAPAKSIKQNILAWIADNPERPYKLSKTGPLGKLYAFEKVKTSSSEKEIAELVDNFSLPDEAIPSEKKTNMVWETILYNKNEKGHYTAGVEWIIKNLGNFTHRGILTERSEAAKFIISRITNTDVLKYARLHPLRAYVAAKVYASGTGVKGSNSWKPVKSVVDALEETFYRSFDYVEPTGKKHILAIDISSSMDMYTVLSKNHAVPIKAREAAAIMAMVTYRTEPDVYILGMSNTLTDINISRTDKLQEVIRKMSTLPFGSTNLGLVIEWAISNAITTDVFGMYTDMEVNQGHKPADLLKRYRQESGIKAKLFACAFTANKYSICDPSDPGMLDIAGFDAGLPTILNGFALSRF